jgi:hypothetical protein
MLAKELAWHGWNQPKKNGVRWCWLALFAIGWHGPGLLGVGWHVLV